MPVGQNSFINKLRIFFGFLAIFFFYTQIHYIDHIGLIIKHPNQYAIKIFIVRSINIQLIIIIHIPYNYLKFVNLDSRSKR